MGPSRRRHLLSPSVPSGTCSSGVPSQLLPLHRGVSLASGLRLSRKLRSDLVVAVHRACTAAGHRTPAGPQQPLVAANSIRSKLASGMSYAEYQTERGPGVSRFTTLPTKTFISQATCCATPKKLDALRPRKQCQSPGATSTAVAICQVVCHRIGQSPNSRQWLRPSGCRDPQPCPPAQTHQLSTAKAIQDRRDLRAPSPPAPASGRGYGSSTAPQPTARTEVWPPPALRHAGVS